MQVTTTALLGAALATYFLSPRADAAYVQSANAMDGATLTASLKEIGYQVTDRGRDVYAFGMVYNKVTYTVDAVLSDSKSMIYVQAPLVNVNTVSTRGLALLTRSAAVSPNFFAVMGDMLYLIRAFDNRGLTREQLHQGVDALLKAADQTRDLWQ